MKTAELPVWPAWVGFVAYFMYSWLATPDAYMLRIGAFIVAAGWSVYVAKARQAKDKGEVNVSISRSGPNQ